MHFLLTLIVSFKLFSFDPSDQELKLCNKDNCSCEAPLIKSEDQFIIDPKKTENVLISCDKGYIDVQRVLECQFNIISNTLCKKMKTNDFNDCQNFIQKLIPTTYDFAVSAIKNCGYNWKKFDVKKYKEQIQLWVESNQTTCHESMCTSATYLAFIAEAKSRYKKNQISKEELDEIADIQGPAWRILNNNAEPNELIEKYNLGTGHVINLKREKIQDKKIPAKGDIVQIWRKNNSGHSVIFKGLLDSNGDGIKDQFCYWSSQDRTNGYGNACESINKLDRLLVGHFE